MCDCDWNTLKDTDNLTLLCQDVNTSWASVSVSNDLHRRPGSTEVWAIGIICVTIISCCSVVGIGLLPLLRKTLYYRVITYCVGLGVGSLSGGAIFHLLPQAFLSPQETANNLGKSWMAAFGVYLFFLADRLTKFIVKYRKRRHSHAETVPALTSDTSAVPFTFTPPLPVPDHQKQLPLPKKVVVLKENLNCDDIKILGTSVSSSNFAAVRQKDDDGNCECGCDYDENCLHTENRSSIDASAYLEEEAIQKLTHAMCSHDHDVHFKKGDSVVATVAWMILFGDGLHNFIDGLSIGAAFTESVKTGVSVSVAVLCEEFPHELGDVAILLNAGMSAKQALVYNLLSASTCYLGFILGVVAGEFAEASAYIFPLAGGMFLYISLATMLPEMNETATKAMNIRLMKGFWVLCLQFSGIFTGLLIMYLMAAYGSFIAF